MELSFGRLALALHHIDAARIGPRHLPALLQNQRQKLLDVALRREGSRHRHQLRDLVSKAIGDRLEVALIHRIGIISRGTRGPPSPKPAVRRRPAQPARADAARQDSAKRTSLRHLQILHRPAQLAGLALTLMLGLSRCSPGRTAGRSDAGTSKAAEMMAGDAAALPGSASAEAKIAAPPANMNVILLTLDSWRADMPWNGYDRPIAPTLTAFAEKGVSYTHAYSLSSYTSMSLGGMLGGKYPGEMKRDGYFFGHYRGNVLFPERLQAAGVKTFAVHAHLYFGSAGFERGFDVWKLVPGLKWNAQTDENVTSPRSEKLAEKLLSDPALTGGRFFAWFHFLDPHDEYKRHSEVPSYGRRLRDLYDGEVTYTDRYIGKLLEFIAQKPWAANTAIIISGDHGEAFGEHGCWRHGFEIWQHLVRVL